MLVLLISLGTFVTALAILILLVVRRQRRPETAVILDAIDGVRQSVWDHAKHTALEHGALIKQQEKTNGRLQFLIAKDIADELAAQRRREETPTLKPDDDT